MASQNENPVKVLCSGMEVRAAVPFFAGGKMRNLARCQWWEDYPADDGKLVVGAIIKLMIMMITMLALPSDKVGPVSRWCRADLAYPPPPVFRGGSAAPFCASAGSGCGWCRSVRTQAIWPST